MSQFQIHTIDTAPEAAKEALTAVKNANGFIPNLIGVLANAPTALETYRTVGGINGRNSLTATEREVVQITAAVVNGCGFCVAGHTKLTEAQLNAFFAAGYTQEQAIDVVLGVSLATLCNYVNNLAETPINPELQAFA